VGPEKMGGIEMRDEKGGKGSKRKKES